MKHMVATLALSMSLAAPAFAQQPENQSERFLKTFDANQDGQVSKDEYIKPHIQQLQGQFDYMDKNKDGGIDKAEADAFAQELQQRMQQQRGNK